MRAARPNRKDGDENSDEDGCVDTLRMTLVCLSNPYLCGRDGTGGAAPPKDSDEDSDGDSDGGGKQKDSERRRAAALAGGSKAAIVRPSRQVPVSMFVDCGCCSLRQGTQCLARHRQCVVRTITCL